MYRLDSPAFVYPGRYSPYPAGAASTGPRLVKITSATDPSKALDVDVDDLLQQIQNIYFSTEMSSCQNWLSRGAAQNNAFLVSAIQQKYQTAWLTTADLTPVKQWLDQQCNQESDASRPHLPLPGPPVPMPPTPPVPTPPASDPWKSAKAPAMVLAGIVVGYLLSKHWK